MADILIKTTGIIKDYGEKVKTRVLFGIDVEILAGEYTSLVGASGSGKSTLLNIIGALDRPTEGRIMIDGIDLHDMNDDELAFFRNQTIGFIFQMHLLLPQFSVLENVIIPHRIYNGRTLPEVEKRARELLEIVGLSHRADYHVNDISGGEQQRAAIARALINNPRIILADEPTGNLDSKNTEIVFSLLREINQELGTSVIMVTHDNSLASRCDRLLVLKDGRILKDEKLVISSGASPIHPHSLQD